MTPILEQAPVESNPIGLPAANSPRPPAPPWRVWEAFVLLGLFFASQLLFSGLAVAVARVWLPAGEDELMTLVTVGLPAGLLASYVLVGAAVHALLARRHRLPVCAALRLGVYPAARLAAPFLGGITLQFVTAVAVAFAPPPDQSEWVFNLFLKGGAWAIVFFFVVAVGLAPLIEETLFRGLLLPALIPRVGFPRAALLVTLLFAALHGFQVGLYWPALVGIFLCGWILAWLRQRSNSLWPPVAFHVGFNFTAFVPVLFLGEQLR